MLKDFNINYRRIIFATDPAPVALFRASYIQLSLFVHAIIILETSKFKNLWYFN